MKQIEIIEETRKKNKDAFPSLRIFKEWIYEGETNAFLSHVWHDKCDRWVIIREKKCHTCKENIPGIIMLHHFLNKIK